MLDKNNEVFFGEYCKTCKYKNYSETDCPCSECIAEPVNLYSHKPIRWEGADGVFSGPPPRPDHAYQRAVKYVPEKRKDKEKAIARQNIDAEYAGNKVQSISDSVTDDQYPSATAVKKALENKIDAPQVAQVGEVLTVEEVDADGNPKKWKTAAVDPKSIKDMYYEGFDAIDTWIHDPDNQHISENNITLSAGEQCTVRIGDDEYKVVAENQQTGRYDYSMVLGTWDFSSVPFYFTIASEYGAEVAFGKLYTRLSDSVTAGTKISLEKNFAHTIKEKYFPKTIFTQENAPVRFGDILKNSAVQGKETVASGQASHAEGYQTTASGDNSHAEGNDTKASGFAAHAEGSHTVASNIYSHAEGIDTKATGPYSHAEGESTVASGIDQHVQGRRNIKDENDKYAHIVGNGNSTKASNAYTLDWEGNAWFAGDVYVHSTSGTNKDDGSVRLATEDQLTDCVRLSIRMKKNGDGTITYFTDFPALFIYYEIFKGRPIDAGNSVECCLIPIESESLTVLNYTGMSIDQNSDGNIVLAIRFSSYASGKQISAEIKDTISGFGTDNEERLSTVVTVTEEPVATEVFSLPLDDSDYIAKGSDGLVPGPTLQERDKFLRADGKWVDLLFCYGDWNEVYKSLIKGEIRRIFTIGSYKNTQSGTPKTLGVLYYNGTNGPKLNYTMFGHDGVIYDIDFDRQYNTFSSMALTNKPLPAPTTAQVGQIVKVKAVDADGKVTETEAVDMPTIPNDYELVFQETVAEDVGAYSRDTDKDGNPFNLTDVMVIIFTKPFAESTNDAGRGLGFLPTSRWGKDYVSCDIGNSISSANSNSVGRYSVVFVKVVNGYQVVTRAYESQNATNVFGVLVRQTKANNEMFGFHSDATKLMQIASPQGNITCVKIVGYTNPLVSAGTIVALYKKKGT